MYVNNKENIMVFADNFYLYDFYGKNKRRRNFSRISFMNTFFIIPMHPYELRLVLAYVYCLVRTCGVKKEVNKDKKIYIRKIRMMTSIDYNVYIYTYVQCACIWCIIFRLYELLLIYSIYGF